MSYRELAVLLQHSPMEAAWRSKVDPAYAHFGPWSKAEHLLAAVADHLAIGNWLFVSANTTQPPPRPAPLPRPGVENVRAISAEAAEYLEQVRAGHGSPTKGA